MLKLLKFQARCPQRTEFLILAGISGLSVCFSFFSELVFGQPPCLLCLVQRGLHSLLFAIALVGAFSYLKTVSRRCCQAALIASCLVAGYHSLIQLNLVKDRCKTHSQVEDIAAYKSLLIGSEKSRPSCSEEVWKVGGIPISAINGILSILLLGFRKKPSII